MRFATRLIRPHVVVLRYHSVQENPERLRDSISLGIVHSQAVFNSHMEWIARRYAPISLEEALHSLKESRPLPRRGVVVTFDDGYRDNITQAAPVLDGMHVPAAFYIVVDSVEKRRLPWFCRLRRAFTTTKQREWTDPGPRKTFVLDGSEARRLALVHASRCCALQTGSTQEAAVARIELDLRVDAPEHEENPMMTWDDLRSLRQAGHIIGSHTMSHPNLAHLQEDEILRELGESKTRLEQELGEPILHFAYPHPILDPHWSEKTVAGTRRTGFVSAMTNTKGPVQAGDDPLILRRIRPGLDLDEFAWRLDRAFLGHTI